MLGRTCATNNSPVEFKPGQIAAATKETSIKRNVLWHPHQKLWNRELIRLIRRLPALIAQPLVAVVVMSDSLVLLARAAIRWLTAPPSSARVRGALPIIYIDCGTGMDGGELTYVHKWFGHDNALRILAFEASPRQFETAKGRLTELDVDLRQVALVGPDYTEPRVRLYRAGGGGRGDSLFAARGEAFDEVTATRLSSILAGPDFDVSASAVMIRMNIEGAEQFVIEDLAEAGVLRQVDGFYGMWDDLSKINPAGDLAFRRHIRRLGIRTFPFNERDLRIAVRRVAIRLDMSASLRRAASRKAAG